MAGKKGKARKAGKPAATVDAAPGDEELLEAAIAENLEVKRKLEAAQALAAERKLEAHALEAKRKLEADPAPPATSGTITDKARKLPALEMKVDVDAPLSSWQPIASTTFVELGACVLQPASGRPFVAAPIMDRCRQDVLPRLDQMRLLARQHTERVLSQTGEDIGCLGTSTDPQSDAVVRRDLAKAAKAGALQFRELYSRNGQERRFDVTVIDGSGAWVGGEQAVEEDAEKAWRDLLVSVDSLAQPVLSGTSMFAGGAHIESCGFIASFPGAPVQNWHPDEALTLGLATVFIPLVDLSSLNGPTELALATHIDPALPNRVLRHDFGPQQSAIYDALRGWTPAHPHGLLQVQPLLRAGDLLLFDWRTWHRGGANQSELHRPLAYVTYHAQGVRAHNYKKDLPSLTASMGEPAAKPDAAAPEAAPTEAPTVTARPQAIGQTTPEAAAAVPQAQPAPAPVPAPQPEPAPAPSTALKGGAGEGASPPLAEEPSASAATAANERLNSHAGAKATELLPRPSHGRLVMIMAATAAGAAAVALLFAGSFLRGPRRGRA